MRDIADRAGRELADAVMASGPCDGFSPAGSRGGFTNELSSLMKPLMDELAPLNIKFWVTEHVKEICFMQDGGPPGIVYIAERLESMVCRRAVPRKPRLANSCPSWTYRATTTPGAA